MSNHNVTVLKKRDPRAQLYVFNQNRKKYIQESRHTKIQADVQSRRVGQDQKRQEKEQSAGKAKAHGTKTM